MTLWEEIRRRRRFGVVRCGVVAGGYDRDAAARLFGLDPDGLIQTPTPQEARETLRLLLTEDLAYSAPIMSRDEADRLIERFAEESGMDEKDTRLFGNRDSEFSAPEKRLGCWTSATNATFDTGILAITADRCACLWVEDED